MPIRVDWGFIIRVDLIKFTFLAYCTLCRVMDTHCSEWCGVVIVQRSAREFSIQGDERNRLFKLTSGSRLIASHIPYVLFFYLVKCFLFVWLFYIGAHYSKFPANCYIILKVVQTNACKDAPKKFWKNYEYQNLTSKF